MTITPLFCSGFEQGFVPDARAALGSVYDNAAQFTIVSAAPRHGTYNARLTSSAQTSRIRRIIAAGNRAIVVRVGFKVISLTAGNFANLLGAVNSGDTTAADSFEMRVDATDGFIKARAPIAAGTYTSGPAVNVNDGAWHYLEAQFDWSTASPTIKWKLDGGAVQTATGDIAAKDITSVSLGIAQTAATFTATVEFDDWIIGSFTDATNDWFGNGFTVGLPITRDGTHNVAANQFLNGDTGGAAFTNSTTTANSLLDEIPWSSTRDTADNIRMAIIGTSNYMEFLATQTPHTQNANAVNAFGAISAAAASPADEGGLIALNSAGTQFEIFGNPTTRQDWTEASNFFKCCGAITKPAAGWTKAEVDLVKIRFGYSNDIAPVPTLQAAMLEVDYPLMKLVRARQAGGQPVALPTPAVFGG